MKFKCTGCNAKYYHNSLMPPPTHCRFCGKEMVKAKMTAKEFKEFYLDEHSGMSAPPGNLQSYNKGLNKGIANGKKLALDKVEKYVQERIDFIIKDARKNGGDGCTKARLREIMKIKERIKSIRKKK